ncbi:MAG: DUF6345 domain-containing protein [Desulfosalsimonadaceae bacterium]
MKIFFSIFIGIIFLVVWFHVQVFADSAGYEVVNNFNGVITPDLFDCVSEGRKFEDAIQNNSSWNVKFGQENNGAWEKHFKADYLGGRDEWYIDDVDLALYSGHGGSTGFWFPTWNDDTFVGYGDVDWGDRQLEWIIIDACAVLNDSNGLVYNKWAWPVFEGLHYILGYSSITTDVDTRGEDFIDYAMGSNYPVRNAWITATQISENNTTAAYLRADDNNTDTYNDHLWGFGYTSDDPDRAQPPFRILLGALDFIANIENLLT